MAKAVRCSAMIVIKRVRYPYHLWIIFTVFSAGDARTEFLTAFAVNEIFNLYHLLPSLIGLAEAEPHDNAENESSKYNYDICLTHFPFLLLFEILLSTSAM